MHDGGRGLSQWEVLRWLRDRDGTGVAERSTSFTAAIADEQHTTLLIVHNYWTEAYRLDGRLVVEASLVDAAGSVLDRRRMMIGEDHTIEIDVRCWCVEIGCRLPFTGQVLLELLDSRVARRRPFQAMAEYLHDGGGASSVHGQFGLLDRPFAQQVGAMRVAPIEEGRTALIVVNSYAGASRPARAEVTVWNESGRSHRAAIEPLPPRASRVVHIDEVVPDLRSLLGDGPGHVALKLPFPVSRVFTYVERPDGSRVVDHGTIDRCFDDTRCIPAGWDRSWPIVSLPVLLEGERDVVVGLANRWGPVPGDVAVAFSLYGADGRLVATRTVRVCRDGFREVSLADLLDDVGADRSRPHHAELRSTGSSDVERPANLDVVVGFVEAGRRRSEVQVGSAFFNAPVPDGSAEVDVRRTRVFGSLTCEPADSSAIFLAHPVGTIAGAAPAQVQIRLLDLSGSLIAERDVELPPHGFLYESLPALAGDSSCLDGHRRVIVKVRSTDARLFGYYLSDRPGTPCFAACHLLGG